MGIYNKEKTLSLISCNKYNYDIIKMKTNNFEAFINNFE
jgi:hypothetical protein